MNIIFSPFLRKFQSDSRDHTGYSNYMSQSPEIGATTAEERAWCQWYGHQAFSGHGAIVEWGPWLGSLTRAYCAGLKQNKDSLRFKRIAHVYDLFRWDDYCEDWVKNTEHAGRLEIGESFTDYYKQLCSDSTDYLNIYESDLSTQKWIGKPIELIINDAVKTCEIGANVFREFMPHLLPGRGYVAHQDYLWPTDAFLQTFAYLARNDFNYEYTVPNSCMVVFRSTRQLMPQTVEAIQSFADFTPDLIEETFAWSRQTLTLNDRDPRLLDLCRAVTYSKCDMKEEALRVAKDTKMGGKRGCKLYDFMIDVLTPWGYGALFDQA